jgi:hypothetical protein
MRTQRAITISLLGLVLAWAPAAAAQQRTPADPECEVLRQRLADHASLSEGVRRAVASHVAATAPAAATPAQASRTEAIQSRLKQIPGERQALEEQRLGAMIRFELSRASDLQAKIHALDAEKAQLERELAQQPAPAPAAAPAPVAAPPASDASRVRCEDAAAMLDRAVKIRQRELGAREGQAGVVPLVAVKGQWSDQIARELAAQLAAPPGAPAGARLGLLDDDGDGRIDGVVDVPVPGVYRLVRRRADGTSTVETFATAGSEAGYGDITRRVDEGTIRATGESLDAVLARRPAGPVRVVAQTADFDRAEAQRLAGDAAAAARVEGAVARSLEYQNYRGQAVRVVETLSGAGEGFHQRRVVVMVEPDASEQWEETTTVVRTVSYWRTEVEVARSQESRTAAGAPVGTRSASGPVRFSVER